LVTLNNHGVEYVLIGGCAIRFWGRRRRTRDVDLLVNNDRQNAENLYEAIRAILGFTPCFTAQSLAEPCKQVRLGAWGPQIDIITSVKALPFSKVWARRTVANENGINVPVASYGHLRRMKRLDVQRSMKRLKTATEDLEFLESLSTSPKLTSACSRRRPAR